MLSMVINNNIIIIMKLSLAIHNTNINSINRITNINNSKNAYNNKIYVIRGYQE